MDLRCHGRAIVMAGFVLFFYWLKEIMELILRLIYGVDRRFMYVPVPQNVHVELGTLRPGFGGAVNFQRRGELFYYVFHFMASLALAIIFYCVTLYAPSNTLTLSLYD